MINQSLKRFFDNYNKKKILESGELFMFNAKLTKQEYEKIKNDFEKSLESEEKKEEVKCEEKQDVISYYLLEDDISKIISLKDNLK